MNSKTKKLEISPDFTVEDIHKIREHNYEITKDMTFEEEEKKYKKSSGEFWEFMNKVKKINVPKKYLKRIAML